MSQTQQELLSKLSQTRHDLAVAHSRVTELEALLSVGRPNPDAVLDREGYESARALDEINSLASAREFAKQKAHSRQVVQ